MFNINDVDREMEFLFEKTRECLNIEQASPDRLKHYILEYSTTSREHPGFLTAAFENSKSVPDLAAELLRNIDEEKGTYDGQPHFGILSKGLKESFGLDADTYEPSLGTQLYIEKMRRFGNSESPSKICGAFLAAEAAAIKELEFLRDITNIYSQVTRSKNSQEGSLQHYYDMHLNGVEQSHKDGLALFLTNHENYGLDVFQIRSGFSIALEAMSTWWKSLVILEPSLALV